MGAVLGPLAAMMAVQAMTMLAVVTVPVLAPAIAADLGVATSRVGLHQSLAFLAAAAVTVTAGTLVTRHGGIRVNQIAVLIAGAGLLATAGGSLFTVALGAALVGGAYGLATPGASHVLARVAPPAHRGLVFSVKQSAVPFGGLLAGVVAPPIAERYGWQVAVLAALVMVVVSAPAIQPLRARLDADRRPGHRGGLGAPGRAAALVLRNPRLRAIALTAFAYGAMQLSMFAFLVTHLVDRAGMSLVRAGLVFSAMQIGGVAARVLWGWVSDRWVPAGPLLALLGAGTVASTLATTAFTPDWPMPAVVAVAVAVGVTAVGWNGIYLAEVARTVPEKDVASATGGILMFTFVGVVAGPSAFGLLLAATGSYTVPVVVLDALVLGAALALVGGSLGRGR